MLNWLLVRAVFYPTLGYNLFLEKVTSRKWYDRIDSTVLLGALPFRSMTKKLVDEERVRGVVTMNEDFELEHFVNTEEEWAAVGVKQLHLPTVDLVAAPSQENLKTGVNFIMNFRKTGDSVYVHCKAGRTRSATIVVCYLMSLHGCSPEDAFKMMQEKRPHVWLRDEQWKAINAFHKSIKTSNTLSGS